MKKCLVCNKEDCNELIDFGQHPICHNFTDGNEEEKKYPLTLGQCQSCDLVQLMSPISPQKLVPRYEWITYNEPEEHLDHLVNVITSLPGISKDSTVCGVSYKEDSTLARLNRLGFNKTWRIDMTEDLGILNSNSNLESIQHHFRRDIVSSAHKNHGVPDLIIVRHILEHTHDTLEFMSALEQLINPCGYVIFEVPDCSNGFDALDYTTIWEEHTLYFTEKTFKTCLSIGGFSLEYFETYDYPFESILIGITKPKNIEYVLKSSTEGRDTLKSEKKRAQFFSKNLVKKQNAITRFLVDHKNGGGIIAMFGTGHAACMFINLFGIKDLIEYAIDDDLQKEGYYMPGSKLPIHSSKSLAFSKVSLCLLGLSSESEKKVVKKLQFFQKNGGIFASIYPGSKYAIQL